MPQPLQVTHNPAYDFMTKPRLWTRDFIIASTLNFFLAMIFYLLVVMFGVYATQELQATVSQAGLVVGIFIIGVLLGRLLIGQIIDQMGCKRVMVAGLVMTIAACLLYFVNAGIVFLIANRFIHGFAVGITLTANATVIGRLVPMSRMGEGVGYFAMSTSLATAIGPFICILMMQYTDFNTILLLCAILSMTCLVVGFLLNVPEQSSDQPASRRLKFSLASLVESKVVPISSVMLVQGICFSGVLAFISAYTLERNLTQAASFYFPLYALSQLVSRPFTGPLLDRYGANIIMYPAFAVLAAGLAILGMAESGTLILLSALLVGLGFGNMHSSIQAIVLKMVGPERMGLANSTFFSLLEVGVGFGPYLLGFIIAYTGYASLYLFLAAISLVSVPAYYAVYGRHEARNHVNVSKT